MHEKLVYNMDPNIDNYMLLRESWFNRFWNEPF